MSILDVGGNKAGLDGKTCWDEYIRWGSFSKAASRFKNPNTLRRVTPAAVERAAYKWAIDNPDVAKSDWQRYCLATGVPPTDERWLERVYRMIKVAYYYNPSKLKKYLEKYSIQ